MKSSKATAKKATKKAKSESKKEVQYVASSLDITYNVPVGLTGMLAKASKTTDKEVWCSLSDMANICASRLVSRINGRRGYASSWTTQTFPGSNIKLRLDMDASVLSDRYDSVSRRYVECEPKTYFTCRVKVSGTTTERFTQAMINDYITDKILLGDFEGLEDEETIADDTSASSI